MARKGGLFIGLFLFQLEPLGNFLAAKMGDHEAFSWQVIGLSF